VEHVREAARQEVGPISVSSRTAERAAVFDVGSMTASNLMALQRAAGNAAVVRAMARCATPNCACGGAGHAGHRRAPENERDWVVDAAQADRVGRQLARAVAARRSHRGSARGLQRRVLARVSASMCCKTPGCVVPDAAASPGSAANSWKLELAVDREEEGLGRLASGNVGHTWVKLSTNNGERWSFGMWPQTGFDPHHPFTSVAGCIHHPDTAHEPPAATAYKSIDYVLTDKQYAAGLAYAQGQCKLAPDYNLMSNNCTSFAIETAKAAGVAPPPSTTLAIHNPNALYEGIDEDLEKRGKASAPSPGDGSGAGKKAGEPPEKKAADRDPDPPGPA
jgi:hypothetical protein